MKKGKSTWLRGVLRTKFNKKENKTRKQRPNWVEFETFDNKKKVESYTKCPELLLYSYFDGFYFANYAEKFSDSKRDIACFAKFFINLRQQFAN